MDAADEGRPLLALIDEIYKGTNSRDRILGATETIRCLAAPHVMTLVTTHDFELCALENDPTADAVNYHFTERYAGDEILFDYTTTPAGAPPPTQGTCSAWPGSSQRNPRFRLPTDSPPDGLCILPMTFC